MMTIGARPARAHESATGGAEPGDRGWRDARRLLRGPLRRLVTGQALGQAGDGLAQIAFAQLVVFDVGKGATPGRIAGVLAVTLLPFTLVGPFAGVLIDRWNRRRTLLATSTLRAVLALGATAVATARSGPLAYLGVVLLLALSRFVLACKGAVLPRTVAPATLVTANAVSSVVGMVAAFVGAVAGSAFVSASPQAGFLGAAVAYLGSAAAFVRLPDVGGGRDHAPLRHRLATLAGELAEGLGVIAHHGAVRRPLLAVWAYRLLLGAGFLVLVLVADERYHLQASGYGLAIGVTGVAAFLGTVAAPPLARRVRPERVLPLLFLPAAIGSGVAACWPSLAVLVVALAVTATSFQCLKVLADALVGRATADVVRGRVFSAYDVLYNVAFVLAGLAMVPLWDAGRVRLLLAGLGAAFVAASAVLSRAGRRGRGGEPRSEWPPRLAALVAGAVPVLAFPAPALWWLAWVALVPWLLLVARAPSPRAAALRGWWAAWGFLVAMHHWLLASTGPFLLLATAALALLWLPWSLAARLLLAAPLRGRHAAAALVVLPSGWVLVEAARSWSSLGGPWGLLGASQWNRPAELASAALGGVWLVSFLVVATNVAVAVLLTAGPLRRRAGAAVVAVLALAVGPLAAAVQHAPPASRTLRVALVQPGVLHDPKTRLERAVQLTQQLPAGRYDLVAWGESSLGFDVFSRPDLQRRLEALSTRVGSDLLVNVDARDRDGAIRKTSVLLDGSGILAHYDKMRLVPFGEYVPFRRALGFLSDVTKAAAEDRHRGRGLVIMHAGTVVFAPLVCFESAFPDMSRNAAASGAQLLVFQSATTTFQGSWAPAQHASLAAVRAVETGRPTIHATLSGVTAVFDGRGHRLAWFDTHHRGTTVVTVPLAVRTTPFVRVGGLVLLLPVAVVVVAGAQWVRLLRAGRRQLGAGPPAAVPEPAGHT